MTHTLERQLHAYGATIIDDQPEITVAELQMLVDQISPIGDVPLVVRAPAERRYLTMAIAAAVVALLVAVPLIFGQLRTDEAPATTIPQDPATTSTTEPNPTTTVESSGTGTVYSLLTETTDGTWRWRAPGVAPRGSVAAVESGFYFLEGAADAWFEAGQPDDLTDIDLRSWLWSSPDGESWIRTELPEFGGRFLSLYVDDGVLQLFAGTPIVDYIAGERSSGRLYVSIDGTSWAEYVDNPDRFSVPVTPSDGITLRVDSIDSRNQPTVATIGETVVRTMNVWPEVGIGIADILLEAAGTPNEGWGEEPPVREGNTATVRYERLGTAVWTAAGQRLSVEVFMTDDDATPIYTGWIDLPDMWAAADFLPTETTSPQSWGGIGIQSVWVSNDGGERFEAVGSPILQGVNHGPATPVVTVGEEFLMYVAGPAERVKTQVSENTSITTLVSSRLIRRSSDGRTWTQIGESVIGDPWGDLTVIPPDEGSRFVSHSGPSLVWSDNGIDWNPVELDPNLQPDQWQVIGVEGGYVAVWTWQNASGFVGSVDGVTWYTIHRPEPLGESIDFTAVPGGIMVRKWDSEGFGAAMWIGSWETR
jgi:hypothetical protein